MLLPSVCHPACLPVAVSFAWQVEGEGVIGLYPILEPGGPEFVYCSCTQQKAVRGSMCGSFKFVPGSMDRPEGPPFDVVCPAFRLDLPEYAF